MSFIPGTTPLSLSTIFPNSRFIDDIEVDVIVSETTNDNLTITKQPVQQGASITDHSYLEPTTLSMTMFFRGNGISSLSQLTSPSSLLSSGNVLSSIYQELLDLQAERTPFSVVTPKRTYDDMLISSIGMTTDRNTENCLSIQMSFQQVIIVPISIVTVPRIQQKNPGATAKTEKAGNKSVLAKVFGGG